MKLKTYLIESAKGSAIIVGSASAIVIAFFSIASFFVSGDMSFAIEKFSMGDDPAGQYVMLITFAVALSLGFIITLVTKWKKE